jgi:hypothetical protein
MPTPLLRTLCLVSGISGTLDQAGGRSRQLSCVSKSGVVCFKFPPRRDGAYARGKKADLVNLAGFVMGDSEDERRRDALIFGKCLECYAYDTVDVVVQASARIRGLPSDFGHEGVGLALEGVHKLYDITPFGLREGDGIRSSLRDLRVFVRHGYRRNSVQHLKIWREPPAVSSGGLGVAQMS